MSGRSARKQNRGNNPTLFGTLVSGKAEDYHTSTSGNRWTKDIVNATGGDIASELEPGNGYRYHCFSHKPGSPQSFVVTRKGTIEILLVGGGGCGGDRISGGGGGGGILHGSLPVTPGTYTVRVGRGGYGIPSVSNGGEPSDFSVSGVSFPSPGNFARAYGGGAGGGYAVVTGSPEYELTPTYGTTHVGGGGAGGSSGGTGNQYGTAGAPGFSGASSGSTAGPIEYVSNGKPHSPVTPAPYDPPAPGVSVQSNPYGSDAPVGSPGYQWPSGKFNQSDFPSTYYMGLQGYGNYGGMAYGPALSGGGAGGGGAGAVGEDSGAAVGPPTSDTSRATDVRGCDGGTGKQITGFTAPLFCDPTTPNGGAVKTALDPLGGYFAGGGGGSNYPATQGGSYGGGRGGDGGGGNGSPNGAPTTTYNPTNYHVPPNGYSSSDTHGVFYSGGGGGGKGYSYGTIGNGGPGIVVIRYLLE